mmetsp:Transcript_59598/g.134391  ORF Transcript_59598/g.134391 Transcript_59598/m.134391 type:complete len:187 (-) Transcript_59598:43-603(-)
MFGLKLISNGYIPDGTGRDVYMTRDAEVYSGRSKPAPYRTACLGRECHPRRHSASRGPKPPSGDRLASLLGGKAGATAAPKPAIAPGVGGLDASGRYQDIMSDWASRRSVAANINRPRHQAAFISQAHLGSHASPTAVRATSAPALSALTSQSAGESLALPTSGPRAAALYGYSMDGRQCPYFSLG